MATQSITGRASEMGREDRQSFTDEFGYAPEVNKVGDYDSTGVTEMWCEVSRSFDDHTSPEARDAFEACRVAYLYAFFDSEDAA